MIISISFLELTLNAGLFKSILLLEVYSTLWGGLGDPKVATWLSFGEFDSPAMTKILSTLGNLASSICASLLSSISC
jgi:hypothetical protein